MKRRKSEAAAPAGSAGGEPGPNKKAKANHPGAQQAPPVSSTTVQQRQLPAHSKDGPDAAAVASDASAAAAGPSGGSASAPAAGEGVSGPDTPEVLQALPLGFPHINLHGAAAGATAPKQQPAPKPVPQQQQQQQQPPQQQVQGVASAQRPAHMSRLQQQATTSRDSSQRSGTPRDAKSRRRATLLMLDQDAAAAADSAPDSSGARPVQPATATQQQSVLDEFLAALGASQHTAALRAAGSKSHAARRKAQLLMLPTDTSAAAAAGTAAASAGTAAAEEQAAGTADKATAQLQQQDVVLDSAQPAAQSQPTDAAAAAPISLQRAETAASVAASLLNPACPLSEVSLFKYRAACTAAAAAAVAPAGPAAAEADACQDTDSRPAPAQRRAMDAAGPPVAAGPASCAVQQRARPGLTPLDRRKALLLQPAAQVPRAAAAQPVPLPSAPNSSEEATAQVCAGQQAAALRAASNTGLWGARRRRLAQLLPPLHPAAGAAAVSAASDHSGPVGTNAQQEREQERQNLAIDIAATQPEEPPVLQQQKQKKKFWEAIWEQVHPGTASRQARARVACQAGAARGAACLAAQQQSADGTGAASTDGQQTPDPCNGQQQQQQPATRVPSPAKHAGASARRRAALLGVSPAGAAGGSPGMWVEELLSVAAAEGCCHLAPRQAAHSGSAAAAVSAGGAKAKRRAQLLELPEQLAAAPAAAELDAPPAAELEAPAAAELEATDAAAGAADGGVDSGSDDGPAAPTAAATSDQQAAQQDDPGHAAAVSPPNDSEHEAPVALAADDDLAVSAPQSVSPAAAAAASDEAVSPEPAGMVEEGPDSAEPPLALLVELPSSTTAAVGGSAAVEVEVLSPMRFMNSIHTELDALVSSLLPFSSDSDSEDGAQELADGQAAAEVGSGGTCPGSTPVKQQALSPAPAADAAAAMEVDGDSDAPDGVSSTDPTASPPPASPAAASPPPPPPAAAAAAAAGHSSSGDAAPMQQLAEPAAKPAVSPAADVKAPECAAADDGVAGMEVDGSGVHGAADVVAAAGSPAAAAPQPSGDQVKQPQHLQQAATPVVSAQQRVCLRQGSPSTPQLQFQLSLSLGSADGAAAGQTGRLQQQPRVADLLQLAGAYAADTLRGSSSAGRDTATQLDQSAAAAPAVATVTAQGESPNTPDTLPAASRSTSQQQRLGLLQPGGSGSCRARHRTRPALGSVAQRRAALLMSAAGEAPAAAAAAAETSSVPKCSSSNSNSMRSGEKLDAWLHFQAAAGFGSTPAALPADVLRDQYQQAGAAAAAAAGPKQQQELKCQNAGSSSGSTPLKLFPSSKSPSAAGLARVSAAVQESPIPRYPGSGIGRSPTALLRGSPRPSASPVVVQHFLSPAPASLRGVRRPSPPPPAAGGAAEAPGEEGADVPPVQSPAPARYIPAAALAGVARTMVYVRLPGSKQARQSKGARQGSSSSSSRSRQAAAPFVSFPLAPGELPDGAGTCAVKETLEQAVRAAHLDLQLAQAAADGEPWAACDLSGLPLDTSATQLQVYKDRYQGVCDRLLSCRQPTDVAKLEKQLATEWAWLQDVRRSTTAAVSQCSKQSILRRKAAEADALRNEGWVVDGIPMMPATGQQCGTRANTAARSGRVKFCLPESSDATA